MWSRHFSLYVFSIFGIPLLSSMKPTGCNPITNSNFNEPIREFSLKEYNNSTYNKTLLKEGLGRNANFVPIGNPVQIKYVSDNAVASSSHSRGFPHPEHSDYSHHDHEEVPYYEYGHEHHAPFDQSVHYGFEHGDYHGHDQHHEGHGYDQHHVEHGHDQHHVRHGHRHYNHALAAKAVLWPLAGIALLGAAAALVSNPILLQLGVATGKRRRRDTEFTAPNIDMTWSDDPSKTHKICTDSSPELQKVKASERKERFDKDVTSSKISDSGENYVKIPTKLKNVN